MHTVSANCTLKHLLCNILYVSSKWMDVNPWSLDKSIDRLRFPSHISSSQFWNNHGICCNFSILMCLYILFPITSFPPIFIFKGITFIDLDMLAQKKKKKKKVTAMFPQEEEMYILPHNEKVSLNAYNCHICISSFCLAIMIFIFQIWDVFLMLSCLSFKFESFKCSSCLLKKKCNRLYKIIVCF